MESIRQLENYYYFQGTLGDVMQILDKPRQWIKTESHLLDYTYASTAQKAAALVKIIFISIPFLPCYLVSRLVYFVAGEKISPPAFQEAAQKWREKLIIPIFEKASEVFINHLIAAKVYADDCSYKNIAIFSPEQKLPGEPLTMYQVDSPIFCANPKNFTWIKKEGRILALAHANNPIGLQLFGKLSDSLKHTTYNDPSQKKLAGLTDIICCNLWNPRDCYKAIKMKERL